jgi:hypothetical protein
MLALLAEFIDQCLDHQPNANGDTIVAAIHAFERIHDVEIKVVLAPDKI